jgi:hypothetical protein
VAFNTTNPQSTQPSPPSIAHAVRVSHGSMASAVEPDHVPNEGLNGGKHTVALIPSNHSIDERLSQDDDETQTDTNHDGTASSSPVISPTSMMTTSPPYWLHSHGHQRSVSNMSAESILPAGAITMRDNETEGRDDRNNACWARSVQITGYVVVNSSATNIGAFVVWIIKVETLSVSSSEFHPVLPSHNFTFRGLRTVLRNREAT